MNTHIYVFTDSSVDPKSNRAIGSYIFLNNIDTIDIDTNQIKHIEFEATSTMAEYLTIKHILIQIDLKYNCNNCPQITIYTDCENFVNLVTRRKNKIKNTHRNYLIYKYLIDTIHKYNINVIWTSGHSKKELKKENYEYIFSLVDKDARHTLRNLIKKQQ